MKGRNRVLTVTGLKRGLKKFRMLKSTYFCTPSPKIRLKYPYKNGRKIVVLLIWNVPHTKYMEIEVAKRK